MVSLVGLNTSPVSLVGFEGGMDEGSGSARFSNSSERPDKNG